MSAYVDCPIYNGKATVVGRVENRTNTDANVKLLLGDISVDGEKTDGKLIAYLPMSEKAKLADVIVLKGEIATNINLRQTEGLRDSAIAQNRRYIFYSEEESAVVGRSKNLFLRIRARMEEVTYAAMDEESAALTMALLTGDCSGVDEDLMENMRYGGISHIFAVSGLNIGALFAFCLLLFTKTPLKRSNPFVRLFVVLGVLWLYVGVCGFTSSVVRAAAACSIAYGAVLLGTGLDPLSSLGFAAIFILLRTPSELFGVGFQLSFAACFGLMLLTKGIGQVFDELCFLFKKPWAGTGEMPVGEKVRRGFRSVLSASLAAQIATAPILLVRFGYISFWSIPLNLFFVPIIDGIFTVLLIFVVVSCCLPLEFASVVLFLPSALWSTLTLVFELVDFSTFRLDGIALPIGAVVCFYLGMSFLSDKWNIPKGIKRGVASLFFLTFLALTVIKQVYNS